MDKGKCTKCKKMVNKRYEWKGGLYCGECFGEILSRHGNKEKDSIKSSNEVGGRDKERGSFNPSKGRDWKVGSKRGE